MALSAGTAYSLTVLSILLVYIELIRPGAILPGVCGLMLLCFGAHELWRQSFHAKGVGLCIFGIGLVAAEAVLTARFISGALGTVALIAGSLLLCGDRIPAAVAVAGGLAVGLTSTVLAALGCSARRNKSARNGRRNKEMGTGAGFGAYS